MHILYGLTAILLFFVTGLPLDAKVFGLIFLLDENKRQQKKEALRTGFFSLNIDGECRYKEETYFVKGVHFFSSRLILLDVAKGACIHRLSLPFDAFSVDDFCHISRICLAMKATP